MNNINETKLNYNKFEEHMIFIITYCSHKHKCMEMLGNSSRMKKIWFLVELNDVSSSGRLRLSNPHGQTYN